MMEIASEVPKHFDPNQVICQPYTFQQHSRGIFFGRNPLQSSFTLLLFEISLVVIITRLVRFLLKPLKQPRIVSEIIGGIIIGPSCLGRNTTFSTYVLPDNANYVMKTFGVLGFMYFLFVCGVKMDLMALQRSGKKHWYIALIGVAVPVATTASIAYAFKKSLPKELAKGSSIWGVSSAFAITAFPVIYTIIKEFNLLSSDIGRMALSTAIIGDVIGINGVVAFEAVKQGETRPMAALWYMISLVIVMAAIIVGIRHVMDWIVRTTPEGKPVDQVYIIAILLGVMVLGFVSDFLGLAIDNGPLWLGLAIPDGPPLGATLVEKSETFIFEILMPFSYVYVGLYTDVFSMGGHWSSLKPFFFMACGAYVTKFLSTVAVSRIFKVPVRDSFALSLIMSLRGQVELILFIHWTDLKMITQPYFTMMVLLTTINTAIASPLINIIYDPTRPYIINKRRNIQHNPMNTELRILVPIQDEQSVPGLLDLLQVSNATLNSPFSVYALRLIELVGRASPLFIDHDSQEQQSSNYSRFNPIHNAFKFSQETRCEFIKMYPFTSVSPKKSMYQDICELALIKKVSLIILPFHKDSFDSQQGIEGGGLRKVQTLTSNVLAHAPCSIALLVDRATLEINQHSTATRQHHFAVLFLGGADAREALAYADRMAGHPDISLNVIRFLSHNGEGDDVMEKKLDDGLVTWFWVKNEGNSKVIYREVVVKNGEETLAAIQSMNDFQYDLWIVGRKLGINPVLLQGLENWSENHELGVIGEYISSMDLGTTASVLVVQQQVLRDQKKHTKSSGNFLSREFSSLYR